MIGVGRWASLTIFVLLLSCARRVDDVTRPAAAQFVRTMPSPEGCYLEVWDRPQYTGQLDYINGPRAYADLRNMPSRSNWENRIASVRMGRTAVATAFTEPNFGGTSFELRERAEFATLPATMNRRIGSLLIRCAATPDKK